MFRYFDFQTARVMHLRASATTTLSQPVDLGGVGVSFDASVVAVVRRSTKATIDRSCKTRKSAEGSECEDRGGVLA